MRCCAGARPRTGSELWETRMKSLLLALVAFGLSTVCGLAQAGQASAAPAAAPASAQPPLLQARKGFKTQLTRRTASGEALPTPPAKVFTTVRYRSPAGELAAFLTPDPADGKKHPAIIWLTGGDSNTLGEVWREGSRDNEQTASAYRKAGVVMLFPSLRGGNTNPGVNEGMFGEVDDVLAARAFLARQPYVDPARIYLGGHSTGGTLALLVAASSNDFRATFSFGPVHTPAAYGESMMPYDASREGELALRSPVQWLDLVTRPVFVIEGEQGNVDALRELRRKARGQQVGYYVVGGADHFSVLAPVNALLARKILASKSGDIELKPEELEAAFRAGR
jgi:dienelactone hydrolase